MRLRILLAACALAFLSACGPRTPDEGSADPNYEGAPAAPAAAAPSASTELLGMFAASSNTAMGITGDVTVDETSLRFEQGHVYQTQVVAALAPGEPLDSKGADLSLILGLGENDVVQVVEVRKIVSAQLAPQARNPGGLCGANGATFVALAASAPSDEAPQSLWLAAFTGADAPGPKAQDSQLCGAFLYLRDTAI